MDIISSLVFSDTDTEKVYVGSSDVYVFNAINKTNVKRYDWLIKIYDINNVWQTYDEKLNAGPSLRYVFDISGLFMVTLTETFMDNTTQSSSTVFRTEVTSGSTGYGSKSKFINWGGI